MRYSSVVGFTFPPSVDIYKSLFGIVLLDGIVLGWGLFGVGGQLHRREQVAVVHQRDQHEVRCRRSLLPGTPSYS